MFNCDANLQTYFDTCNSFQKKNRCLKYFLTFDICNNNQN